MPYTVLKPFLYFVQGDIIEEATDETKSADYTLLPNELKIALELGGVQVVPHLTSLGNETSIPFSRASLKPKGNGSISLQTNI